MRYALGIDGGGSKCEAVLLKENAAVVGWGRGGPTHIYYDPPEVIAASYVEAVSAATMGLREGELWVASYLDAQRAGQIMGSIVTIAAYLQTDEKETAFAAAQESWGLVVLAGTGSFVHGRTEDRRSVYYGALGPTLGDYGSAYQIGLSALRAAFASDWTSARKTSLAQAVPRALGAADRKAVFDLVYVHGVSRRQIAGIARVVNEEAEAGDAVAAHCLRQAADELAALAVDAIGELKMQGGEFALIAIGGVAQGSRIWWDQVCRRVREAAPRSRPVIPSLRPAVGAALLALREMGVAWTPELVARAVATQRR